MKKFLLASLCMCLFSGIVSADIFGSGANEFTIDFVTISGNTNPASGYGIVNNDYRMGTYEITNDQFAKLAANTPFHVGADVPANVINWFEAVQFVNILNTSTGNQAAYKFDGSTFDVWSSGDIGYDAINPFRNSNAKYFLPTEDEWVKAAYWNDISLQTYATTDDSTPIASVDSRYNTGTPWDVTSGSEELNGTYNMMGNVWEWTESPYDSGNYLAGSDRTIRGGSYSNFNDYLRSSYRAGSELLDNSITTGFRVASVPEPATMCLLGLGGLLLRRKRQA